MPDFWPIIFTAHWFLDTSCGLVRLRYFYGYLPTVGTRLIVGRYAQLRNLRNMTFEDFRLELEAELEKIVRFELEEFHYEPYSFGNGLLAYRINGRNYRFRYDGREKQITVDVSEQHQKYFGASWNRRATIDELSDGVTKTIELLNLSKHSK